MKTLNIIECAYRATIEEQDDTVLWLMGALKNAGAEVDVVLAGNAVNYAVKGQDASGLRFGDKAQKQPPRIADDLAKLLQKGSSVFVVKDDVGVRGLESSELIAGLSPIDRSGLPELFTRYDQVWRW